MTKAKEVASTDVPAEAEFDSALEELLNRNPMENMGRIISGVLEFLTMRALHDGPFYILTDDKRAMTVFACDDDTTALLAVLPDNFKAWEEDSEVPPFDTNSDPGDEQVDTTKAE